MTTAAITARVATADSNTVKTTQHHAPQQQRGRGGRGRGGRAKTPKQKMTKEERRKKYTDIARQRRSSGGGSRHTDANMNKVVCFHCRQTGHIASECPTLARTSTTCRPASTAFPKNTHKTAAVVVILCYKCGSTEHNVHTCPKRHKQYKYGGRAHNDDYDQLPFALCFICKQHGHLASACPTQQSTQKNATGVYPNGGTCHICGSIQHLAKHCPEKQERNNNNNHKRTKKNPEQEEDEEVAAAALIEELLEAEDARPVQQRIQHTNRKLPGGRDPETMARTMTNNNTGNKTTNKTTATTKRRRVVNF